MATEITTRECREREAEGCSLTARTATILTTHHKHFHPAWTERTVLLPDWYEQFERANASHWQSAKWAFRLFQESRKYDAVVTGAEHCGLWFAMLQTIFRRRAKRVPHVMIDFPWAARPERWKLALKALQMRFTAPALNVIFAHASSEEAERFTNALRVRAGLFQFVPFHHSFGHSVPEPTDGDYIFCGGNYGRDYHTFIEALRGTDHKAIICAQKQDFLADVSVPPNIQVTAVSHRRFLELIAGSAAVVVPLRKGDIHPGGHTVVVHAMAHGKPIIVAGPQEYRSYIDDGVTGVITPAGDVQSLRATVERIISDRVFAHNLGEQAKKAAARFAPEEFFSRVFEHVDCAVEAKRRAIAVAKGASR